MSAAMFSERKTMHRYAEANAPAGVTLVAQRATEVTDIPGVPQQPGWVRPEGRAPSEKGPQAMSRSLAVSRAEPGSPGAVQAVSVASTVAVQIRPDPGDDDGSI